MNITIFGASGRTGSELLHQALRQGHRVTAFVRQSIARADVAHFMLQQLTDRTYSNKAVRLMKTKIETN